MKWVVVGLGNPGGEYEGTRHNTGRAGVEFFASKQGISDWRENKKAAAHCAGDETVMLVLPNTYMNKSGKAVAVFVKSQKAAGRLVVVHDDLDLPLGAMKISFDRGSGGHRGVESIMRAVKTKKFVRIRVGVSPATSSGKIKKPHGEQEVEKFILSKFKTTEEVVLKKVFKRAADALEVLFAGGLEKMMSLYN